MTKDDLVTTVVKSCKGDDLSKRLVSDVIDAAFDSIGKSIKKDKHIFLSYFKTCYTRCQDVDILLLTLRGVLITPIFTI